MSVGDRSIATLSRLFCVLAVGRSLSPCCDKGSSDDLSPDDHDLGDDAMRLFELDM